MPENGENRFEKVAYFAEPDDDDEEDDVVTVEEKLGEEEQDEEALEEQEEKDEDEVIRTSKTSDTKKNVTFREDVILTKEDARQCLNTIGRTADGLSFAFINIDAVDRRLTDVSAIRRLKWVLHINVSDNKLTEAGLGALSRMNALSLKADRNKISTLEFPLVNNLRVLSLKSNAIESTVGLEGPNLAYLHLDNNKIKDLVLDAILVPKLKCLTASNNQIKSFADLIVPTLRELYLGRNLIKRLDGLDRFRELRALHVRGNQIKRLKGFNAKLEAISYINLRENKIENLKELKKLAVCKCLRTLVTTSNPFNAADEEDDEDESNDSRIQVLARVIRLTRLDKDPVKQGERQEAVELKKALDGEEEEDDEDEESEDEDAEEEAEGDDDDDED